MKKVYIDANIMMDFLDENREYDSNGNRSKNFKNLHETAKKLFATLVEQDYILLISEDIMTNIAYNLRHKKEAVDKFVNFLSNLENIENFQIVPFGQKVISSFADFYKRNDGNVDFEDGLQYFCALENGCEAIYTNDKSSFPKLEISLINSDNKVFYKL